MNATCFSSADPAAANASIVFDFDSDVNLWEKADLQTALPLCSTSSAPPAYSACLVCRDQEVFFAVCRALRHGAKVTMEAMGKTMKIREIDCPLLRSDDGSTWPLPVVIAAILLILFFFFLVGLLFCKCWRKSKPLREENATPDENGSSLLPTKEAESPV